MTEKPLLEAIAYVDVTKTGYDALVAAVLTRWSVDGIAPSAALYGEEIYSAARDAYLRRSLPPEEYQRRIEGGTDVQ